MENYCKDCEYVKGIGIYTPWDCSHPLTRKIEEFDKVSGKQKSYIRTAENARKICNGQYFKSAVTFKQRHPYGHRMLMDAAPFIVGAVAILLVVFLNA